MKAIGSTARRQSLDSRVARQVDVENDAVLPNKQALLAMNEITWTNYLVDLRRTAHSDRRALKGELALRAIWRINLKGYVDRMKRTCGGIASQSGTRVAGQPKLIANVARDMSKENVRELLRFFIEMKVAAVLFDLIFYQGEVRRTALPEIGHYPRAPCFVMALEGAAKLLDGTRGSGRRRRPHTFPPKADVDVIVRQLAIRDLLTMCAYSGIQFGWTERVYLVIERGARRAVVFID